MNTSINFTVTNSTIPVHSGTEFRLLNKYTAIVFSILNIVVFVFGVTGNLLTLVVLVTKRRMRKRSIHLYTLNLCVSDLLVLLFFVPTRVVALLNDLNWTQGTHMCRVSYVVIPTGIVTTVATLLSISVDRAKGVLYPIIWRTDSKKTAKVLIPIIWAVSIIINLPFFHIPVVEQIAENRKWCKEQWFSEEFRTYYWFFRFVLTYVIPLVFIFIIQSLIAYFIKYKIKNPKFRAQNQRMVHMTVAIVVVFALCTGFDHVFFFMNYFGMEFSKDFFFNMYCTSSLLMVAQSAINPFLYGKFRGDLRLAYKKVLLKLALIFTSLEQKDKTAVQFRIRHTKAMKKCLRKNKDNVAIGGSTLDLTDITFKGYSSNRYADSVMTTSLSNNTRLSVTILQTIKQKKVTLV